MKFVITLLGILILTTGITTSSVPAANRVLNLDSGRGYVEIPSSASLNIAQNLTIESWIKPAADSETFFRKDRVYHLELGGQGYGSKGSRVQFSVYGYGFHRLAESSSDLELGVWHHVAVVYDQNVGRIYINGRLDTEQNLSRYTGEITGNNRKLEIGRYFDPSRNHLESFSGQADEVRIWNVARTHEQIQAAMNTILMGQEDGLAGYWNFDDGTANDLSPNGNDGVLQGDAQIVEAFLPDGFIYGIGVPLDLTFYFPFETLDGDIALDQSGKGHNGVINGDIRLVDSGRRGKAAEFAAGSFIDLDGSNIPAGHIPVDQITLCAWVKCKNIGDSQAVFNARANDNTWVIHPEIRDNGQFRWLLRSNSMAPSERIFDIRAGNVKWDEWTHYAGVYDGKKGILYINGEKIAESPGMGKIAADWGMGARIGRNMDGLRSFTGLMDDVCLWKKALTQEDIMFVMERGPKSLMTSAVVSVQSKIANPGEQFNTNISVSSGEALHSFAFDLTFGPSILQAVSVEEGPFLSREGVDATSWGTIMDNKNGVISGVHCSRSEKDGVEGRGILATVTFEAIGTGSADLGIQNLRLLSPSGEEVTAKVRDVSADVYPHGRISGVIFDSVDNMLIQGVKVEIYKANFAFGFSAYSDYNGTYTIDGVPIGDFDVTATIDGYIPKTIREVRVEQGKDTADVDIKLTSFHTASTIAIMTPIAVGESATDFVLQDIDGNQIIPSDFAGKPIVLNFWDSTSEHCQRQTPHLDALYKKYKGDGLVMIGVSREMSSNDALEFARSQMSYITVLNGTEAFQAYGVTSIPCTYYIDKTGEVRYRDVGFPSGGEVEMEQKILGLIGHR